MEEMKTKGMEGRQKKKEIAKGKMEARKEIKLG